MPPAVGLLREYRDAKPAVDSAKAVLDALGDGSIVRGNLDQLGTLTGRYSCSNPPLQALDARVRRAVEAAPGCLLLEADSSQMELRVLAHFSQDQALLAAFEHNQDLHRRTAARVLGIAEDAVTEQQRKLGKTLNFSILYGQSAYGLADDLAMPIRRAQALLDAHAEAYPGVAAWIANVYQQALADGEVHTLYGRRRYLPNIFSASPADAAEARRHAVNTISQGTAADLLKMALVRLHDALPDEVRVLLSVHDSVLLEVRAELVERDPPDRNERHGNAARRLHGAAEGRSKDGPDVGRPQIRASVNSLQTRLQGVGRVLSSRRSRACMASGHCPSWIVEPQLSRGPETLDIQDQ